MAVGGPNILIPGISDEAWEALKETGIESLSNLVQTELLPRLFEKSFFGGSALGAVAGTAIRSLGTYLNTDNISFAEALNQSARFSLQTLSYIATGTSTSKLVNLLFRNKGLALATSRLFGKYSELVFREVGSNLISNPLAQTLGHFIGLPSLPFSLKDGAYFAVSGSLGAIREAHIARGWAGIVAEGVHRIADTWVQNSMNGRITSGLDLIRATSSSFQKMMGGSLKTLGLSQRPEHTNIPQPVVDAWNHPVTQTAKHMANRAITPLARLAAGASGLLSGTVYSPSLDLGELSKTTFNLMGSETKISIFGPNRTIYQTAVPVIELSKKGWLEHLSTQLKPHIKKNDPLELDVALNVENDTIKPYSIHLPPKEPEKERTHLRFSFSRNEKNEVVVRFVDLKQGDARNGDQEQVIMHLAGNPALSEYPPRLQEARANYLLNGIVLGLQRKRGRWNYDGCTLASFHTRWSGHKLQDIFGSDPCFQHLPPEGIEILYTGTMDGDGNLRRMSCFVANSGQTPSDNYKYFKIRFKLSSHQNEESPPIQTTSARLVSEGGPGTEALATSMHLIKTKEKTEGPLDRNVGKPVPLQTALGLDNNTLTMDDWYRLLADKEYSSASFTKIATHLEGRGDDLSDGVMISGQIRKKNMASLIARPGNKAAPTGGSMVILVAKKSKDKGWIYTQVDGSQLSVMHSKLLLGQCSFDPELATQLVANTLTLGWRGEAHLQTAGYRLLTLDEASGLAGNPELSNTWGKIRKARPDMEFASDRPVGVLVVSKPRNDSFQLCISPEREIPRGDHVYPIPLYPCESRLAYREPLPRALPEEIKQALRGNPSLVRIEAETPELQSPPLAKPEEPQPEVVTAHETTTDNVSNGAPTRRLSKPKKVEATPTVGSEPSSAKIRKPKPGATAQTSTVVADKAQEAKPAKPEQPQVKATSLPNDPPTPAHQETQTVPSQPNKDAVAPSSPPVLEPEPHPSRGNDATTHSAEPEATSIRVQPESDTSEPITPPPAQSGSVADDSPTSAPTTIVTATPRKTVRLPRLPHDIPAGGLILSPSDTFGKWQPREAAIRSNSNAPIRGIHVVAVDGKTYGLPLGVRGHEDPVARAFQALLIKNEFDDGTQNLTARTIGQSTPTVFGDPDNFDLFQAGVNRVLTGGTDRLAVLRVGHLGVGHLGLDPIDTGIYFFPHGLRITRHFRSSNLPDPNKPYVVIGRTGHHGLAINRETPNFEGSRQLASLLRSYRWAS